MRRVAAGLNRVVQNTARPIRSGAVDTVVVQYPDGSMVSTPIVARAGVARVRRRNTAGLQAMCVVNGRSTGVQLEVGTDGFLRLPPTDPDDNERNKPSNSLLRQLGLSPGMNTLEFAVYDAGETTAAAAMEAAREVGRNDDPDQGTGGAEELEAGRGVLIHSNVYVYQPTDKLVISDIDGTITTHDMTRFGRGKSHEGVAELYEYIEELGYKVLYLTARPVGDADLTRRYLATLTQGLGHRLPRGPLLLSPYGTLNALRNELTGKSASLKTSLLMGVHDLFPRDAQPFMAGFGNRHTDFKAYVSVGIPTNAIFMVDRRSRVHSSNNHDAGASASEDDDAHDPKPPEGVRTLLTRYVASRARKSMEKMPYREIVKTVREVLPQRDTSGIALPAGGSVGRAVSSIADTIGATPTVKISPQLLHDAGVAPSSALYVKLEYMNPGGSKKDRIAKQIVDDAMASGALSPGQPVVEMTSGNTGTGLAIVCRARGHPFIAVMSRGNSRERAEMMQCLGAEVILVDQGEGGTPGMVTGSDIDAIDRVAEVVARERAAFRADQFHNISNFNAHYQHTGPEMHAQVEGLNAFCDFVGSGGTFAGCSAYLKQMNEDTKCFVVEPEGCAVLSGQSVETQQHPIQGGGYAMADLDMLNVGARPATPDGHITVTGDESIHWARQLARREGIFGGYSTGANVAAAIKLMQAGMPFAGRTVCVVACDSGLKYVSTGLWDHDPR